MSNKVRVASQPVEGMHAPIGNQHRAIAPWAFLSRIVPRAVTASRIRTTIPTADRRRPAHRIADAADKRTLDVVLAVTVVAILLPALLTIALLIKATSGGTVLFKQKRYGLGGRQFEIWKFRTMYTSLCDQAGVQQTKTGDARITPVGRFLRRTSLDELPQLINVIKGDMSLVGPRPHVPGMLAGGMLYEELVTQYQQRHAIRPGITGLAQVRGYRGSTEDPVIGRERIRYDFAYIRKWSFGLDLQILIMTAWQEIRGGTGD